jgi:hypothetical protein
VSTGLKTKGVKKRTLPLGGMEQRSSLPFFEQQTIKNTITGLILKRFLRVRVINVPHFRRFPPTFREDLLATYPNLT